MVSTDHIFMKPIVDSRNPMPRGMLSPKITICFFLFENLLSEDEDFLPYEC